jgi:hypothetical protein
MPYWPSRKTYGAVCADKTVVAQEGIRNRIKAYRLKREGPTTRCIELRIDYFGCRVANQSVIRRKHSMQARRFSSAGGFW